MNITPEVHTESQPCREGKAARGASLRKAAQALMGHVELGFIDFDRID